jgi:hypothetical protein
VGAHLRVNALREDGRHRLVVAAQAVHLCSRQEYIVALTLQCANASAWQRTALAASVVVRGADQPGGTTALPVPDSRLLTGPQSGVSSPQCRLPDSVLLVPRAHMCFMRCCK